MVKKSVPLTTRACPALSFASVVVEFELGDVVAVVFAEVVPALVVVPDDAPVVVVVPDAGALVPDD